MSSLDDTIAGTLSLAHFPTPQSGRQPEISAILRRHLTYDQRVGMALKIREPLAAEVTKRKGGRPSKDEKPSVKLRSVSGKSIVQVTKHRFG